MLMAVRFKSPGPIPPLLACCCSLLTTAVLILPLPATHQCAQFTHDPHQSHATAVKSIIWYLKDTQTKGLVCTPPPNFALDCYVDTNFAGLWNAEDQDEPVSVKSRTGLVIMLSGCPLVWQSKHQRLIALSTMEAEYVALSTSMHDLIPLHQLVEEVAIALKCDAQFIVQTHSTVFEDNNIALALANLPHLTPCSKHISVWMHWFQEHIQKGDVQVVKVHTNFQVADIFTKGLAKEPYERIRKLLMAW